MRLKKVFGIIGGILLLFVVVVGIVVARFFWLGSTQEGAKPPAADAPEAPKVAATEHTQKTDDTKLPDYKWPPKFLLPLTIQIEPPPVPDRLREPTPMPKKDEASLAKKDEMRK